MTLSVPERTLGFVQATPALCIQPSVLEDLEVCELPKGCLQEPVYPVYGMRCYEADLSDLSDLGLK